MKQGFPYARAGQTIGLLGGSFDPVYAGHAHITREALKRFGLDRIRVVTAAPAPVPVPAAIQLLAGLSGLGFMARRKKRKAA